ncbi:MAG: YggU family protein [Betaproteobacteria bacterium RIFCSPLOWO2_02_FULL_65_24]|nr:MAG: YggU family protein [Betaproteobacteria bacterium RIFCSPLOWO2_02_FULL_65_24]
MSWYRRTEQGWLISVHAQPGAKKSAVAGLHGEALKVRVAAPPVGGKANDALIAFIAKALGVPWRTVSIVKGESSREKLLLVADSAADPARLLPGQS